MADNDATKAAARTVEPEDWGRVILEEVLFRAARDISRQGPTEAGVTISLDFRLTADEAGRAIEISTPGAVEPIIRTRLPLDG